MSLKLRLNILKIYVSGPPLCIGSTGIQGVLVPSIFISRSMKIKSGKCVSDQIPSCFRRQTIGYISL